MSKEKESRSAVSAGIGYTIGNILIKGINFLSVPLFSRIMTPDELGVYSAFVAYDFVDEYGYWSYRSNTIFRPVIKLTWAAGCLSLFAGVHEFWLVGAKSL